MTVRPLGEGAEVEFSPIRCRNAVAMSRLALASVELWALSYGNPLYEAPPHGRPAPRAQPVCQEGHDGGAEPAPRTRSDEVMAKWQKGQSGNRPYPRPSTSKGCVDAEWQPPASGYSHHAARFSSWCDPGTRPMALRVSPGRDTSPFVPPCHIFWRHTPSISPDYQDLCQKGPIAGAVAVRGTIRFPKPLDLSIRPR